MTMKKISENVVASGRSLTLINDQVKDNTNIQKGALKTLTEGSTYTVNIPVEENDTDKDVSITYTSGLKYKADTNKYVSFDAKGILEPLSIDAEVMLETHSIYARALNTGCVITDKLAEQAVTTPKIKDLNVTTEKVNNLAITNTKLGNGSVTNDKIANSTIVAYEKVVPSTITTELLVDYSVDSRKIANGAVINEKLGTHAVTTEKIADKTITNTNIADKTILGSNIADGTIDTINYKDSSISTVKLQDGCITEPKLATGAVTSEKIALNTITADNIKQGAINSACIENDSIETVDLHDACVTMEKLAPDVFGKVSEAVIYENSNPDYALTYGEAHDHMVQIKRTVNGEGQDTDLYVSGHIYAKGNIEGARVYNMAYADIAEGYIPGEELEPGDIVELRENGRVYKACLHNGFAAAVVGVISDEYAACYGASEKEIKNKEKVAVALVGKVHVKVNGPAYIGSAISASDVPGAGTLYENGIVIGRALETSKQCGVHKVLCLVRPC